MRNLNNRRFIFSIIGILTLQFSFAQMVMQSGPETAIDYDVSTAKIQFKKLAEVLGVSKNLNESDYETLAKLEVDIIGNKDKEKDEKMAAYTQIVVTLAKARGLDTIGYSSSLKQSLMMYSYSSASISKAYKFTDKLAKYGEYGRMQKIGSGKTVVILLADIDTDETLYKEMAESNKDRFTMYIITMPGVGGALPLPWPTGGHYSENNWWSSYEESIIKFIKSNNLKRPIVVGSMSSAYTAAKLAIKYPDLIGKAVLLNGLVKAPMISQKLKGEWAPLDERINRVDNGWKSFLFELAINQPPTDTEAARQMVKNFSQLLNTNLANTKDTAKAIDMYTVQANMYSKVRMQYYYQLQATDLSIEFKDLKIPILVIPAGHDDKSPGGSSITAAYTQFEEIQKTYPDIPLTVVPFYDSRAYIALEAPIELGNAIAAFAENKPVVGKPKLVSGNRKSSLKEIRQQIGSANLVVGYGSPKVNGREIWGKLVPYNDIWRAGANEATSITIDKSLKVEGKELPAGSYSFFVIPQDGNKSWTVIFNKIVHQWGAFNHLEKFDVLRINVQPTDIPNEEELKYSFENIKGKTGELVLSWEKKSVRLKISE